MVMWEGRLHAKIMPLSPITVQGRGTISPRGKKQHYAFRGKGKQVVEMMSRTWMVALAACLSLSFYAAKAHATQVKSVSPGLSLYSALREFDLSGGTSRAENL